MAEEIEIVENTAADNSSDKKEDNRPVYKKKRVLIPIILSITTVICGLYFYNHAITYESTDDAFVEGHIVQVSPKAAGNISKVYVDDNQQVQKGQILAEIDPVDYQVKYEQALARLQAAVEKQKSADINVNLTSITSEATAEQASSGVNIAQSNIEMAEKQIALAKAALAQANNDIESVKAEYNLAETDFNRYQKLFKKGAVSKQDFDRATTGYKTKKAKYGSVLEKKSAAESTIQSAYANKDASVSSLNLAMGKYKGANTVSQQMAISHAQRKIAIAEIKQLQSAAKQAKLDLSYTKIYAPQAGSITGKAIEEGAYIQTGQPLLAIVPEKRWIIANFKETQLNNMRIGQPVIIKVDAYPHITFKGRVDSLQSSTGAKASLFPPENAVGSFVKVVQRIPVKIVFTEKINPQYAIVPGMSVIPEVKVK